MGIQCRIPFSFLSFPFLLFVLFTIPSQYFTATDTLTQSQPISAGQTLISSGLIFELGFFIPINSSKQYVGIWQTNIPIHDRKVVWVANRENPLTVTATNSASSSLTIGKDGNLRLLDGMNNTVWFTNVSVHSKTQLQCFQTGETLHLKIVNEHQNRRETLPKFNGHTTAGFHLEWFQAILEKWSMGRIEVYRDTGRGDGFNLIHDNQQGSVYMTWHVYNTSYVHFTFLTPNGTLKLMYKDEKVKNPYVYWMVPVNRCDIYGVCGPFGVCNNNMSPNCECLKGFVPNSIEDWKKGNWAGGCVRKADLQCQKNTSSLASSGKAQNDGFWKLRSLKLPDHYEYLYTEDSSGCQQWCLSNCSCGICISDWN
ncbi:unnamed protein product [Camellia sinensis]